MPSDSRVPQEASEYRLTPLIRACRTATGLTAEELARRIGVSFSTILDYEGGEQIPTLNMLHKIITATGYRPCATSGSLALAMGSKSPDPVEPRISTRPTGDHEGQEEEAARLRARVETHLASQGFQISNGCLLAPVAQNKDQLRALHAEAVAALRDKARNSLARFEDQFVAHLARGTDVVPERIQPALVPIAAGRRSLEALLWRWCSLHWSIPVSSGYGRRLRFLIVDRGHGGKVIGLIGLADPVFGLGCRDTAIGWSPAWRKKRLFSVMDAFVLGAVPPYNALCGSKLAALLATSTEVRDAFSARYRDRVTLISQRKADARLALVTTSSALGSSSVYNRLARPNGGLAFQPVGYSSGTGDFHFAGSIYRELSDYASSITPDGGTQRHERWTGKTFRNRREVIQRALDGLGYDSRKLRVHGVQRQVFVAPLASNAFDWLRGESECLEWSTLDCTNLASWWLERWAIQRAARVPDWRHFDPQSWRLYP